MPPGYGYVEHDAPARDVAFDPSIESYEEAEAKKRAFFEAQERAKREALQKAEEAQKNSWSVGWPFELRCFALIADRQCSFEQLPLNDGREWLALVATKPGFASVNSLRPRT